MGRGMEMGDVVFVGKRVGMRCVGDEVWRCVGDEVEMRCVGDEV